MVRKPCSSDLRPGLNKGAWTPHEDLLLKNYVQTHGEGNWSNLPHKTGLLRCGRSCRLRWMNYLRPDVNHDNISADEEELIIRLHKLLGNRWSLIAARIAGRTDNQIKNVWYSRLSKKVAKTATQRCNVVKPVPYKYKTYPRNEDNIVTANPEVMCEQIMDEDGNHLPFEATKKSGNGEEVMKQIGDSADIELIINHPVWLSPPPKAPSLIEMQNTFGNSDNIGDIISQSFCWASSSLSPLHFNGVPTSSEHLQGTEDAQMRFNGTGKQIVKSYD
ncbi:hypothetical protein SUGI_0186190 [Cryptomeria japonica]|uniref:transcription factor TT2-like n=1 Tax=Cryptomeria japonica TaxID=3369 RepID=UPI002408EFDC|nr:transcription factor TT2-like [Cryptomeria japonica]GLJ12185.1 hypothetical protein SUGI_0186190 [Cryptomeria japonica]